MQPIRLGYAVIGESDPALTRLTVDSILRQEHPADLVVIAASSQRAHASVAEVTAPGRVEYVSVAHVGGLPPARGALYQRALRTAAPVVDVIVFCSEGLVFRADHAASVVERFHTNGDLVGALEIVSARHDFNPALGPVDLLVPDALSSTAWRKGMRRQWWRARILTECTIAARTATLRGLSFEVLANRFNWTEFSDLLARLKSRGRVLASSTSQAVAVAYRPERRSGFDRGYEAYCAINRGSPETPAAMWGAALETCKLAVQHALRAALSEADRHWCVSFLKGMSKARSESRSIRRAVARDIRDMA
jgi:hypothetical protein